MSAPRRVQLVPAFLLHHRPWRDSSRILDFMTREHGRVTLFAHGARRPGSPLRGVLQPFLPLLLSWSGRADGGTLTGAELAGLPRALPRGQLMSGFYLNELLLRLLPREEEHRQLFDAYAATLDALHAGGSHQPLRRFELVLLRELGYGLELDREAGSGEPLQPGGYYHFRPGQGVFAVREPGPDPEALPGRDLLALAAGELGGQEVLSVARRVLRAAIGHCLEGRGLHSREVMLALRRQEQEN